MMWTTDCIFPSCQHLATPKRHGKGLTHRWNHQQIRVERAKPQPPQRQSQIIVHRRLRNIRHQPNRIQRPEIIVLQGLPQPLGRNGLAVMHIALGRIVSQHAVNDNGDFAVREPPVGAKPCLGLHGRGGHHEEGGQADAERDEPFDQEHPLPARPTIDAAHVQEAKGHETGDDGGGREGGPEVGEANGELA